MLALYLSFFLAFAIIQTSVASRGDEDQQLGQVPVKESPPHALNNVTIEWLDFSRNKGCHGAKCSNSRDGNNSGEKYRKKYRGGKKSRGGKKKNRRGGHVVSVEEEDISEQYDDFDDACSQRRQTGDCGGSKSRWYFDQREGTCKRFRFSGCGGNQNNFASKRRCEQECGDGDMRSGRRSSGHYDDGGSEEYYEDY